MTRLTELLLTGLLLTGLLLSALLIASKPVSSASFVRGDANQDGAIDLSDGVSTLLYLFLDGNDPTCADASDANDSGRIDLSDAVYSFSYLFSGGAPPASPFPECGDDPTDDELDCASFAPCTNSPRPNVLLIIADDFGVDAAQCYGGTNVAPMETLRSLCSSGVLFRNAYSAPVCTPTRATVLTGRYGFRTGVDGLGPPGLSLNETTLPQVLDRSDSGYALACFGKWHLGTNNNGGATHPNLAGFPIYAGSLTGGVGNYELWDKTVNGQTATSRNYATTETVDDALVWIDEQNQEENPWFLWLAFNAPHTPFHLPPSNLHDYDLNGTDIDSRPRDYYNAAVEAMDREIGRLLDSLPPGVRENTNIIFVGDNGTPGRAVEAPLVRSRAKDSLYEGGVHVPLVIAGPAVAEGGREVDTLVNTTDLFATILELVEVDWENSLPAGVIHDSTSLVPQLRSSEAEDIRQFALVELFGNMASEERKGRAIRDERYKLIRFELGSRELYDLQRDPNEQENLLSDPLDPAVEARLNTLDETLDALLLTAP